MTQAINDHNFQVLSNRERGELYYVNSDRKLTRISGFCGHLWYYWNQSEEQKKVKQAVSAALEYYNGRLSDTREDKNKVQRLFRRIGHLSPHVLDRSLFLSQNKLSKHLLPNNVIRLKIGGTFLDYRLNRPINDTQFIAFDLGNKKDNANFAKLLNRQENEIFQVNKEGKLKTVSSKLKYRWNKREKNEQIQNVVGHLLNQLNAHLERIKITRTHKIVLEELFTKGPLFRMSSDLYNRGSIKEGSHLEKVLIEIFDSKLFEKWEALKATLKAFRKCENKQLAKIRIEYTFMDLCFEEFKFAQKLGYELEAITDGGSGGARYARTRFGHKLLVIKPEDEGPHGKHNPQWIAKIKKLFVTPRECLEENSEPQSEVDSYLFDRYMGIYQVPPTDLRDVASHQFNGKRKKRCSVQMFVDGCKPLNKHIGIQPKFHILPRSLLRWNFGEEGYCVFTREKKRHKMLEKIPEESANRLAVHNFGVEDIDCHFENVLVKEEEIPAAPNLMERLFAGEDVNNEIDTFMTSFFEKKHNQDLIDAILFSEDVQASGKRITLVKHDGGSSNPYFHPSSYLATRFKHLFEVLPHFELSFSQQTQDLLADKKEAFIAFLLEKGVRALRNIHDFKVFKKFWDLPVNRKKFKEWLLTPDLEDYPSKMRLALIFDLLKANPKLDLSCFKEAYEQWITGNVQNELMKRKQLINDLKSNKKINKPFAYLNENLKRINRNIFTRVDSWRIIQKYLSNGKSMRDILQIRTQEDFEYELRNCSEFCMDDVKKRSVKKGSSCLEGDYFVENQVLIDLGESDDHVF